MDAREAKPASDKHVKLTKDKNLLRDTQRSKMSGATTTGRTGHDSQNELPRMTLSMHAQASSSLVTLRSGPPSREFPLLRPASRPG